MIELTSLNGNTLILNSALIETMNQIPETKITLTNGNYYLVKQSQDEVIERIIEYNRKIFKDAIKLK